MDVRSRRQRAKQEQLAAQYNRSVKEMAPQHHSRTSLIKTHEDTAIKARAQRALIDAKATIQMVLGEARHEVVRLVMACRAGGQACWADYSEPDAPPAGRPQVKGLKDEIGELQTLLKHKQAEEKQHRLCSDVDDRTLHTALDDAKEGGTAAKLIEGCFSDVPPDECYTT